MLSITTISPKQGEAYYKQENYYSKEEAKKHSEWFGRSAETFGLSGNVESEDFKNLLHGKSPNGKQSLLGKKVDPEKHRAGVDMTFSAPKSLSVAALVGGNERLIEAHRNAVKHALEVIQERYAQARIMTAEGRSATNTGNLIVAQFHHNTSRAKDPQLHTHCVVINATRLENGDWRALHNDQLYKQKMLLGQIYRNELAASVQKLGYEIEQKEDGLFEIKGYTQEQLEVFSKRSVQIKALVGENASSREKEIAALINRPSKGKEIPQEQLHEYWQLQAEAVMGFQHPQPQTSTQTKTSRSTSAADRAIEIAIEHCSERSVNFKREDVEKFVLAYVGQYSWTELQSALNRNGDLLKALDNEHTTQTALRRELDTINLVDRGQGKKSAIAHPEAVESYLENKSLTQGQREAIALAATTQDQFIAWQGVAGAGKTYALDEFKQIAQSKGYTIKGYAPSSEAAKVLGEEVGIESNTVARLLVSKKPEKSESKQIWVVDEAGLLSAKDAHALLKRATDEQARVILVGDTRQLSAVEAGNPFKSLQRAGMQTAYLNQSLRQKVEDLQQAVDLVADGKIAEGIKRLETSDLKREGRIEIVSDQDERSRRIATDYMKLTPEQRQKTLILAGTNKERLAITKEIRQALKLEGSLGEEAEVTQLKAKDLTSVQMRFSHHYQTDDVVMPLRDYKRLDLKKGELYTVVNKNKDSLTLQTSDGSTKTVDPAKFRKAVYEREQIEIATGDRLRWTKNDRELERRNGQEFTVTAIKGNTARIAYHSGKTEQINLNHAQHLDRDLVSTTYSSQGKTAERVLVSVSNDRTLGKESFYVGISRAKYDLRIYAESSEALIEKAQSSRAKKNPLEVIEKEHEKAKADFRSGLSKLNSNAGVKADISSAKLSEIPELEQQNLGIRR